MIPDVIINRGIIEREISSGKVDYGLSNTLVVLSLYIFFFQTKCFSPHECDKSGYIIVKFFKSSID